MDMPPPPVVLAYGIGVDSTALLVELVARGQKPDLVLSADTGVEKPATYAYLDVIRPWMDGHGIRHELVSYTPKRFKHWPPYYGLLEMCLTNATLPSKSLGGSSCSLKYKKAPQDALLYDCQSPLREWGWDRDDCVGRIIAEGLPVPPKSACWLCIANKPEEIRDLPRWCLRLIVLVEARAAPRLHTVEGLWRRSTKARPGRMTDFIRAEGLLPEREIDRIWRDAPLDLIRFQDVAALVPVSERPTMQSWLERFNAGLLTRQAADQLAA